MPVPDKEEPGIPDAFKLWLDEVPPGCNIRPRPTWAGADTTCLSPIDPYGQAARREPQDTFEQHIRDAGIPSVSLEEIPEDSLFTYAVARGDLEMPPGKMASQLVHACRLSLLKFIVAHPERLEEFISLNSCGSVVTVRGRNLADLERAMGEAERAGIPCAIFSDSGHVMPPHFDGSSVTTALAIGPATRAQMRPITKRFRCL